MIWVLLGQVIFIALIVCAAALNWATSGPSTPTPYDEWKRHH